MVGLIKGEDLNYLTDKEETCSLIIAILQCMMNTTNYFGDVGKVSVVGNTVSPLSSWRGVLDTSLCDKVCQ